jgi:hypothetical protein
MVLSICSHGVRWLHRRGSRPSKEVLALARLCVDTISNSCTSGGKDGQAGQATDTPKFAALRQQ